MLEPVLMSDPRVTGLPVQDSGEKLIDLEAAGVLRFSGRKRVANPKIAFARESVAELLSDAAAMLPGGIVFLGVEAY